jgi:porphobilinogen synthase
VTFPAHRGRRLRRSEGLRALARETRIAADQLVAPLFVHDAERDRVPIAALAGHARLSPEAAAEDAAALAALGVGSVLLLGIPLEKDAEGTGAWASDGPVPARDPAHQEAHAEMVVWADVCLCEYTDHGHCGVLRAATWTTMPRCRCSRAPRSPTRRPAPTWWRPRT